MGGNTVSAAASKDRGFQELLGLRASVHPDGSDARITLHTSQGRIDLSIAFEQISAVHSEIRQAALLMLLRQSRPLETSPNPIDLLVSTALKPARVSALVDRKTGDRLFVQEFHDRMPIVTRMSAEDVNETLAQLTRAVKATAQ